MIQVFFFCAVVGGSLLLIQTVLTAFGLADADMEVADDIALEFDGEIAADCDADANVDGDGGEMSPGEGDSLGDSHGSNWLFGVLSFRTLVAATTFFGLSGTASTQAGLSQAIALIIAVGCGVAAMFCVHVMMRTLYRLSHDGTVRISDAIGKQATVYLPVPANRDGSGKVQVRMADRIMEYEAVSSHDDRMKTGTKVIVVDVLGPSLVEVEPEGGKWKRDALYRASQIAISDE